MKKLILLAVCFMLTFILISCGLSSKSATDTTTKETYMLNDRQKEILKSKGLPDDYEKLTPSQQNAIIAIEDMLTYLEKEYPDDTFCYAGYVNGMYLEKEQLIADCSCGEVTVYREYSDNAFVYEDNYNEAKATLLYEHILNDYIGQSINDDDFIVDVSIGKCNSEDYTKDDLLSMCVAGVSIYVRESVGEREFSAMCKNVEDYFDKHANGGSVMAGFYLIKETEYYSDLPSTFESSIKSDIVVTEVHYSRYTDGKTKVY